MRAAIVHHLLSGQAWFSAGAVLIVLLAAESSGWLARRPRLLRLGRVLFLLAPGVAALSGTPVPLWLLLPLALSLAGVVAAGFRGEPTRAGRAFAAAALCAVLAAIAVEAPYHRAPQLEVPRGATVAILGDSLSSGGFGETAPWPERLGAARGLRVANLALPGETLPSSLLYQLPRLADVPSPALVVVELGGNDLLEGRTGPELASDLDRLLGAVRGSTAARVVMFELPIPPGRWAIGAAQRRIARKHGVPLIPKAVLTRVLADPRLVDDGLHLTDAGHARIALSVSGFL